MQLDSTLAAPGKPGAPACTAKTAACYARALRANASRAAFSLPRAVDDLLPECSNDANASAILGFRACDASVTDVDDDASPPFVLKRGASSNTSLAITHAPGHMYVSDLTDSEIHVPELLKDATQSNEIRACRACTSRRTRVKYELPWRPKRQRRARGGTAAA